VGSAANIITIADARKTQNKGMTKREQFAMSAPEPPDWFQLKKRPKPLPVPPLADTPYFAEKLKKWEREYSRLEKANSEYDEDRYFSWRWYYAKQMMKLQKEM